MHNQDIGVVIVTWNGWAMLQQCLESLTKQTVHQRLHVVVVDNGSTDGTLEGLHTRFPEVTVLPLPRNTGFAYPNNLGICALFKDPSIQFVVTVNNDMTMTPSFIKELVACSVRHPDAGSIQGRLYRAQLHDMLDCVGILVAPDMSAMNRGQRETAEGRYIQEEEIFGPSASAALYTRGALERVCIRSQDYFDPYYFAYYEDVQLAWRLRLCGFTSWYTPSAVAFHAHSATGVSHSPFKAYHIHRNQYCNIITLLPFPLLCMAFVLMPIRYLLLLTSVLTRRGPSAKLSQGSPQESLVHLVFRGWKDLFTHLPLLLETRRAMLRRRRVPLIAIVRWLQKYPANIRKMVFGQES